MCIQIFDLIPYFNRCPILTLCQLAGFFLCDFGSSVDLVGIDLADGRAIADVVRVEQDNICRHHFVAFYVHYVSDFDVLPLYVLLNI